MNPDCDTSQQSKQVSQLCVDEHAAVRIVRGHFLEKTFTIMRLIVSTTSPLRGLLRFAACIVCACVRACKSVLVWGDRM